MREFSSAAKTEEIRVDDQLYVIHELTQASRDIYLKELSSTLKVRMISTGEKDAQGKDVMRREVDMLDLTGSQVTLLAATMKIVDDEGEQKKIEKSTLKNWPAGMVEKIAAVSSKLNGLEVAEALLEADAEKN